MEAQRRCNLGLLTVGWGVLLIRHDGGRVEGVYRSRRGSGSGQTYNRHGVVLVSLESSCSVVRSVAQYRKVGVRSPAGLVLAPVQPSD